MFFETLLEAALTWSQEAKKMIPMGTRGGLKKAAIQFSITDMKKLLSEPVTRYLEVRASNPSFLTDLASWV